MADAAKWFAKYFRIEDPSEKEFNRYMSSEELDQVRHQCVMGKGFPSSDGVNFDVPPGQTEGLFLAEYE